MQTSKPSSHTALISFMAFWCLVLLFACKRDDRVTATPPPPEDSTIYVSFSGSVEAEINGVVWSNDTAAVALINMSADSNLISLGADKELGGGCSEFSLGFHYIPRRLG